MSIIIIFILALILVSWVVRMENANSSIHPLLNTLFGSLLMGLYIVAKAALLVILYIMRTVYISVMFVFNIIAMIFYSKHGSV